MAKTPANPREVRNLTGLLKPSRSDILPYRQIFDHLQRTIPCTTAVIVSTLPRAGLQVTQPPRAPEAILRLYSRQFHKEDRPSWRAIIHQQTVRARDCWRASDYESSLYYRGYLRAIGVEDAAVAPLSAPLLSGYAGALHFYREAALGRFSDADLARIESIAGELDEAIARSHAVRISRSGRTSASQRVVTQVIFDQHLNIVYPRDGSGIEQRLLEAMSDYARFRLGHVNGKAIESDRVSLPDVTGDLLHFRATVHRTYPALGEGPFVFFCPQPACRDWALLRPADVQADPEIARLVPAMKFMREQYHRGPTLSEIARSVQLSPFHFHRRFTELFGITPKHFMLDCQIEYAKAELRAREKDLAEIASRCGFAHQSHFTSRFKQATGLTPMRWRRMAAGADQLAQP